MRKIFWLRQQEKKQIGWDQKIDVDWVNKKYTPSETIVKIFIDQYNKSYIESLTNRVIDLEVKFSGKGTSNYDNRYTK